MQRLDSTQRTLCFDVEADGLLHNVTKIHCIYAHDMETKEGFLFHDQPKYDGVSGIDGKRSFTIPVRAGTLRDGAKFISKAKSLICHNVLGYDFELLRKFYEYFNIRYDWPRIRDTLQESQVQDFKRKPVPGYKGVHGLEPWGARLGVRKPTILDWKELDKYKLNRCIEDVVINAKVADTLEQERAEFKSKYDIDFTQSLNIEQEYRYWCTKQELNGCKVDKPHIERCLVELDEILTGLKEEIEPSLPPAVKRKGRRVTYAQIIEMLGVDELEFDKHDKSFTEKSKEDLKVKYLDFQKCWDKSKDGKYFVKYTLEATQTRAKRGKKTRGPYATLDEALVTLSKAQKGPYCSDPRLYLGMSKIEAVEQKDFYCPVTTYLNKREVPQYRAVNRKLKVKSGAFNYLREARQWVRDNYPESKGWGYPKTMIEATCVNVNTCNFFGCEPTDTEMFGGPFSKVEFIEGSTLGQSTVVKSFLKSLGWIATEYNYKKDKKGNTLIDPDTGGPIRSSPKLTEDSYDTIPEGLGQSIAKYNTLRHRRTFMKNEADATRGIYNNIREDGRTPAGLMTFGSVCGRGSHFNLVNIPSVKAVYGENMRKMVVAEDGYILCGIDMANAHPRILSFHTQNQRFLEAVRSGTELDEEGNFVGTDYHTVNAILFNLITEEDRDKAVRTQDPADIKKVILARGEGKGLSFLCIYGGSATKLAGLIGCSVEEAKRRIEGFFQGLGLDILLEDLNEMWDTRRNKDRGGAYISVYGGYHVWCGSKHKLINTMAIGSEAALQKYSINWVMREITRLGLDVKLIAGFHDEALFEVNLKDKEAFQPIAASFYEEGAQLMDIDNDFMSIPLWGYDYSSCH